ncbi:MAG: hypothetical protein IKZ53_10840 [Selenomonadaceae bacterium]|nr:hypothetical protein [Selenomonadaceae bacterium]
MVVDGVKINFVGIDDYTREEAANYLDYVRERTSIPVKSINVKACEDGLVDVSYTARGEKFERIRRITGFAD